MKQVFFLLFLSLQFACADAQSTSGGTNGYKASNEGWLVDLDKAYELSRKTGKPIMANFTGSDWCGWCKRLTASVFSKQEFKTWADKNVILLEVDFPRRFKVPGDIQAQNNSLQQAFQVTGFPTVWVFYMDKDKTGNFSVNALGKTGYTPSVEEFTSNVDQMIAQGKKKTK
ncbi:MAG: thioredoxin family protein [Saprospiraceae bacterium]|nr:thioredoxin family protein [Saprospiraceae bacterium]